MSKTDSCGKSSELCDEFVGLQESTLQVSTDSLVETTDFRHGLQSAGDAPDFGRVLRSEFGTQEPATMADSPRRLADPGHVAIVLENCAGPRFRMYISILNRAITTPLDAPQVRTDTPPSAAPPQCRVVSPLPLVRGLEDQFLWTRRPCSFRLSTAVSLDLANVLNTDLWARIEDALLSKRVPSRILVCALRRYFDGSLPNSSELADGRAGLLEIVDSEQTAVVQRPSPEEVPEVRRRDESPEPVVQERPRRKSIWKTNVVQTWKIQLLVIFDDFPQQLYIKNPEFFLPFSHKLVFWCYTVLNYTDNWCDVLNTPSPSAYQSLHNLYRHFPTYMIRVKETWV
ncbi:unnamed protein product [Macrosiphum euphorbiae]|uniref:Uncharacterized protein n=1 Tax=Macrosiphum euphorbiae TaxID=13131 RepID=A0AAV0VR24_9HEMI|nr:unnamed protein product [Macrosiphum euphorbiae]